MALDYTYFYLPLEIAQIEETSVQNNIARMIKIYEPAFLDLLLGKELAETYKAGIAVLPTPDAKWTALKNKLYRDLGDGVKVSPVANYVYFYMQRKQATNTTGTGEKLFSDDKTINVSNAPKCKEAWNEMVIMNQEIVDWLDDNEDDYTDWDNFSNTSIARIDLLTPISRLF